MTWEKATRRVSLADSTTTWTELLAEIDQLGPEDRFDVELTGNSETELRAARVGGLIARGYSLRGVGPADPAVLVPRPSGVLYIVSPFGATDGIPTWISHVSAEHFRQHLLVLNASDETFARLASECAGESWHLDAFVQQSAWAEFVMELIGSREIDLVQVVNARFGVDLVPSLHSAYPSTRVVVDVGSESDEGLVWLAYVTARYGNVIDAFCASHTDDVAKLEAARVSTSNICQLGAGHEGQDEAGAALHEEVYGRLIATLVN